MGLDRVLHRVRGRVRARGFLVGCVDLFDGAVARSATEAPAVVGFSTGGDHPGSSAPVLAHFAADDAFVSGSGHSTMERALAAARVDYRAFDYPGTGHWFAESAQPAFDPGAADLALTRTTAFLERSDD